jgi:hypothetical protein
MGAAFARKPSVTGSRPWFDQERNKRPSRSHKAASLTAPHVGNLPVMQNHEIIIKLTPANLLERFVGIGVAYLTMISDGVKPLGAEG